MADSTAGLSHKTLALSATQKLLLLLQALLALIILVPQIPLLLLRLETWDLFHLKVRLISLLRRVLSTARIPATTIAALSPPTTAVVEAYARKHHLPLTSHLLPPDASAFPYPRSRLHVLPASPTANRGVLLYFHGGGYTLPASASTLTLALRLASTLNLAHVALLEYTLAPAAQYPTQLAQAATALSHLLTRPAPASSRASSAAEIFVAGDSAGGNLALALLAHLHSPHPRVPAVKGFGQGEEEEVVGVKLGGVAALSPRVANGTGSGSFRRNAGRDLLDVESTRGIMRAWRPKEEVWAAPIEGGVGFWRGNGVGAGAAGRVIRRDCWSRASGRCIVMI